MIPLAAIEHQLELSAKGRKPTVGGDRFRSEADNNVGAVAVVHASTGTAPKAYSFGTLSVIFPLYSV